MLYPTLKLIEAEENIGTQKVERRGQQVPVNLHVECQYVLGHLVFRHVAFGR